MSANEKDGEAKPRREPFSAKDIPALVGQIAEVIRRSDVANGVELTADLLTLAKMALRRDAQDMIRSAMIFGDPSVLRLVEERATVSDHALDAFAYGFQQARVVSLPWTNPVTAPPTIYDEHGNELPGAAADILGRTLVGDSLGGYAPRLGCANLWHHRVPGVIRTSRCPECGEYAP